LSALDVSAHHVTFTPLLIERNASFTVAGLGDRLYASDGKATYAFNAATLHKESTYSFGCARLQAIVRSQAADVLACETASLSNAATIFSVPR